MVSTRQLLQAGVSRREIREQAIQQRRVPQPVKPQVRQIEIDDSGQVQQQKNTVTVGGEKYTMSQYNLVSQYIEDKAMGKRGSLRTQNLSLAEQNKVRRLLSRLLENPRIKEAFEGGQSARIRAGQLGFSNVGEYIETQSFAKGVETTPRRITPSMGMGTSTVKKGAEVFDIRDSQIRFTESGAQSLTPIKQKVVTDTSSVQRFQEIIKPEYDLSTKEGLQDYARREGTLTQTVPEETFGQKLRKITGYTISPERRIEIYNPVKEKGTTRVDTYTGETILTDTVIVPETTVGDVISTPSKIGKKGATVVGGAFGAITEATYNVFNRENFVSPRYYGEKIGDVIKDPSLIKDYFRSPATVEYSFDKGVAQEFKPENLPKQETYEILPPSQLISKQQAKEGAQFFGEFGTEFGKYFIPYAGTAFFVSDVESELRGYDYSPTKYYQDKPGQALLLGGTVLTLGGLKALRVLEKPITKVSKTGEISYTTRYDELIGTKIRVPTKKGESFEIIPAEPLVKIKTEVIKKPETKFIEFQQPIIKDSGMEIKSVFSQIQSPYITKTTTTYSKRGRNLLKKDTDKIIEFELGKFKISEPSLKRPTDLEKPYFLTTKRFSPKTQKFGQPEIKIVRGTKPETILSDEIVNLPNLQQYLIKETIGKYKRLDAPLSAQRASKLIKKDQKLSLSDAAVLELGKDTNRISQAKVVALSKEVPLQSEIQLFDVFAGYKSTTKPFARATGKIDTIQGKVIRFPPIDKTSKEVNLIKEIAETQIKLPPKKDTLVGYHSTAKENIRKIAAEGLQPSAKTGVKQGISEKDYVSLGTSYEAVKGFGRGRTVGAPKETAVLRVEIPKKVAQDLKYNKKIISGVGEIPIKEVPSQYLSVVKKQPAKLKDLTEVAALKQIPKQPRLRIKKPQMPKELIQQEVKITPKLRSEIRGDVKLDMQSEILPPITKDIQLQKSIIDQETKTREITKEMNLQKNLPRVSELTITKSTQIQKPKQRQIQRTKLIQKQKLQNRFKVPRFISRRKPLPEKPKEEVPLIRLPKTKQKKKMRRRASPSELFEPIVFPVGFTARQVGAFKQVSEKELLKLAEDPGRAIGIRAIPILRRNSKRKSIRRKRK